MVVLGGGLFLMSEVPLYCTVEKNVRPRPALAPPPHHLVHCCRTRRAKRFLESEGRDISPAVFGEGRHSVCLVCNALCRGAYLRLIDSCIIQLKAQGPARTCNESKEEEEEERACLASTRPAAAGPTRRVE